MSPVDESLFDRDLALIRQRYGNESIHMGDEMLAVERIPLPSPGLMRITSGPDPQGRIVGGIPIGRMTRIYGGESTGKTQISYMIIAAAQAYRSERFPNGLSCCYWNIEKQFDLVFAASQGIDNTKLKMMQTDIIEDIAAQLEVLLSSIHLHVIDSASFAEPMEELVGGKDKKRPEYEVQVGAHARAWKRAINRIHTRMDKDENIVIVIDHVGVTGIGTGQTHESPLSGRRLKYRSDLSLLLKSGSWLFYDSSGHLKTNDQIKAEQGMGPAGLKEADGREVSVRVEKSRVCRPLRAAKLRLDLNEMRFDYAWELAEAALYYDITGQPSTRSKRDPIVTSTSNGYYRVPGYDKALHGWGAYQSIIAGDPVLQQTIMRAMMAGN